MAILEVGVACVTRHSFGWTKAPGFDFRNLFIYLFFKAVLTQTLSLHL